MFFRSWRDSAFVERRLVSLRFKPITSKRQVSDESESTGYESDQQQRTPNPKITLEVKHHRPDSDAEQRHVEQQDESPEQRCHFRIKRILPGFRFGHLNRWHDVVRLVAVFADEIVDRVAIGHVC
jgi:hypothetical protein